MYIQVVHVYLYKRREEKTRGEEEATPEQEAEYDKKLEVRGF